MRHLCSLEATAKKNGSAFFARRHSKHWPYRSSFNKLSTSYAARTQRIIDDYYPPQEIGLVNGVLFDIGGQLCWWLVGIWWLIVSFRLCCYKSVCAERKVQEHWTGFLLSDRQDCPSANLWGSGAFCRKICKGQRWLEWHSVAIFGDDLWRCDIDLR